MTVDTKAVNGCIKNWYEFKANGMDQYQKDRYYMMYNNLKRKDQEAVEEIKKKLDHLGGDGDLSEKDIRSLGKDQDTQALCMLLKKDSSLKKNIETVSADNIQKDYGSGEEVAKKIPGLTCKYGVNAACSYGTTFLDKNNMSLLDKDGNVIINCKVIDPPYVWGEKAPKRVDVYDGDGNPLKNVDAKIVNGEIKINFNDVNKYNNAMSVDDAAIDVEKKIKYRQSELDLKINSLKEKKNVLQEKINVLQEKINELEAKIYTEKLEDPETEDDCKRLNTKISNLQRELKQANKELKECDKSLKMYKYKDTKEYGPYNAIDTVLKQDNKKQIIEIAEKYYIQPELLAGVVASEIDFDHDTSDKLQDGLGRKGFNKIPVLGGKINHGAGVASTHQATLKYCIDYLEKNKLPGYKEAKKFGSKKNLAEFNNSVEAAAIISAALSHIKGGVNSTKDMAVVWGAYRAGVQGHTNDEGYSVKGIKNNCADETDPKSPMSMGKNAYMSEPYFEYFEKVF